MFPTRIVDLKEMKVSSLSYDPIIDSIFRIAGYETAIALQGFCNGNESIYLQFFRKPREIFHDKSLAEVCLEGRTNEVLEILGR